MKKIALIGLVLSLFVTAGDANAGEPKLLGSYGGWSAYYYYENGSKVCYMASIPEKAEGNYTKRGDIFAFITHRVADNVENEFNYIAGYPYLEGSEPVLSIDGNKFILYTNGEVAWADDSSANYGSMSADNAIAAAIRKGSKMIVKGKSKRSTLTTDSFSLKGSSKAHDAINKECNVK